MNPQEYERTFCSSCKDYTVHSKDKDSFGPFECIHHREEMEDVVEELDNSFKRKRSTFRIFLASLTLRQAELVKDDLTLMMHYKAQQAEEYTDRDKFNDMMEKEWGI